MRGAPGRRRGLSDAGFLSPNVCRRRSSHAVSPRRSLFCVSAWTRDRQRHIAGATLKKQFIFSSASLLKPPSSASPPPHPFLDHVQASETTPLQALKPPGRAGPVSTSFSHLCVRWCPARASGPTPSLPPSRRAGCCCCASHCIFLVLISFSPKEGHTGGVLLCVGGLGGF